MLARRFDGAVAALLGALAFLLFTGGGAIAWPTHTDWLMSGDPAAGFLGWQFFRHTPLWQWPLGANPGYGLDLGSSIVFSDSVPLLAFLFKPLSPWLPAQFQYLGAWLALCFMLQAWFGWKLALRLGGDRWFAWGAAAFFAIAPIACQRLMGHYALASHWLLLAALWLYLEPVARRGAWVGLLAVAALVHAYLLVMVMLVFGADLLQRAWSRQRSLPASALLAAATLGVVALLMWAAGYFMVGGLKGVGISNTDYGLYHMNLLAAVDSDGIWSRLVPDRAGGPGDYEGFAFLGSGMWLLVLVAIGTALVERRFGRPRWSLIAPLLMLAGGALVVAASNRVALGEGLLLSYRLPELAMPLASAFRVSGRFAWLAVYLAYLAVFWTLARRLSPAAARAWIGLALVLQLVDGAGAWRHFSAVLTPAAAWDNRLSSPLWTPLAADARRLVVVPPRNNPEQWVRLADLAMQHGLGSGALSVARVDAERAAQAQARRARELGEGPPDPAALYIVQDERLWQRLLVASAPGSFVGQVDDMRVYAPSGCRRCDPGARAQAQALARSRPAGEGWRFTAADAGPGLLGPGWSVSEAWGTWSEGPASELTLPLPPDAAGGDVELEVEGMPLLVTGLEKQRVLVSVNGRELAQWQYLRGSDDAHRTLLVPAALVAAGGGRLRLALRFPDAASPRSVGMNDDTRVLGLGLVAIRLRSLRPAGG